MWSWRLWWQAMSTLDDLNAALGEAIADYEADNETSADDVFYDLFVSVVTNFLIDHPLTHHVKTLTREFCRTQLGYVPSDLVATLGRADWLDA